MLFFNYTRRINFIYFPEDILIGNNSEFDRFFVASEALYFIHNYNWFVKMYLGDLLAKLKHPAKSFLRGFPTGICILQASSKILPVIRKCRCILKMQITSSRWLKNSESQQFRGKTFELFSWVDTENSRTLFFFIEQFFFFKWSNGETRNVFLPSRSNEAAWTSHGWLSNILLYFSPCTSLGFSQILLWEFFYLWPYEKNIWKEINGYSIQRHLRYKYKYVWIHTWVICAGLHMCESGKDCGI